MTQRDDPSYELISAYVDGELTPDECARVEQLVASSDEYRQTLAEYRDVSGGMKLLPACRLDPAFPDRVLAAARTLGVALDEGGPGTAPCIPALDSARAWHWPAAIGFLSTLAAVALAAVLIWGPDRRTPTPGSHGLVSQATPHDRDASSDSENRPETRDRTVVPEPVPSGNPWSPPQPAPDSSGSSVAVSEPIPKAAGAETIADQPRPLEPPPMPDDDRAPGRAVADVPFSGAQQMLLVIDVALTQQGLTKGAFEQALAAQGIGIEGAVPVDTKIEEVLLASRFFEPVKAPTEDTAATDTGLSLMYVRARAGQADDLWRAMQADQGNFSSITLDMAIMPADQLMFQDLRRAVDLQSAKSPAVADAERRAGHTAAHRLALAPSWRGMPVARPRGAGGTAGMIPAWMLDRDAREDKPIEGIAGQPTPTVPLPPGGRLGENVDAEVLFVVHVGRVQSGE